MYPEDKNTFKVISDYAKTADLDTQDIHFGSGSKEIRDDVSSPDNIPDGIKSALVQLMHTLIENLMNSNVQLEVGKVSAKARHLGEDRDRQQPSCMLESEDESDGTRKLMVLAPAIESVLCTGGILLVDELERELHLKLVNFIVAKFQSRIANPNGAQVIFTTHNTELMNPELLHKDRLYSVDKCDRDGMSELYSVSELVI